MENKNGFAYFMILGHLYNEPIPVPYKKLIKKLRSHGMEMTPSVFYRLFNKMNDEGIVKSSKYKKQRPEKLIIITESGRLCYHEYKRAAEKLPRPHFPFRIDGSIVFDREITVPRHDPDKKIKKKKNSQE